MSSARPRFPYAVAGFLGAWMLRLMRWSWRIREEPRRFVAARCSGPPGRPGTLYVSWHSRILLSAATQAWQGVSVLVSQHGDGEYIVRAIERLGFRTIRGSSTRGGARALLAIVRTLEEGSDVALTPDGPKGPRLRVQPGCVLAAMKSRAAIVPIAFECSRAKRLASWDRFVVPWAFARVAVLAGDPIEVPEGLDGDGVAAWCAKIEAALDDVTRRAASSLGVAPETADADPLATARAATG